MKKLLAFVMCIFCLSIVGCSSDSKKEEPKQEVKQEYKELEGDPLVKGRLRLFTKFWMMQRLSVSSTRVLYSPLSWTKPRLRTTDLIFL